MHRLPDDAPPTEVDRSRPVYIAGHRGLVGSAVWRRLERDGYDLVGRTHAELDLTHRDAVFEFIEATRPGTVIIAAAKVGGIGANSAQPHDFWSSNLQVQVNVMDAALAVRVPKLVFLGSSCIYPRHAEQPIREDSLLTGPLEPTNDAYAIAKIAGVIGVQAVRRQHRLDWVSAMPTNLYGPGDNFSPTESHLLPALIRRYDQAVREGATSVTNWGTGAPKRELLHVDDCADAVHHVMHHHHDGDPINIGTGQDLTIREIAELVAAATGFTGAIEWDPSQPDGMPRKALDTSRINALGWQPRIPLERGIAETVAWYRENRERVRE